MRNQLPHRPQRSRSQICVTASLSLRIFKAAVATPAVSYSNYLHPRRPTCSVCRTGQLRFRTASTVGANLEAFTQHLHLDDFAKLGQPQGATRPSCSYESRHLASGPATPLVHRIESVDVHTILMGPSRRMGPDWPRESGCDQDAPQPSQVSARPSHFGRC
jgi:hypothetical protein